MLRKFGGNGENSCRPRIDYPCDWQYTIIGESRAEICRVVEKHVREEPVRLTDSNVSRSGRYVSMKLEVTVHSEEQRRGLYTLLTAHPAIRVVL